MPSEQTEVRCILDHLGGTNALLLPLRVTNKTMGPRCRSEVTNDDNNNDNRAMMWCDAH